ncbi:putative FHA domain containing protein [Xenorhabdus beddingii]|uniref:Putative FHA domain containing protein n=1 Tax=Xenorhabdus beddingii TaxID=40578 RepID=A0A1Y2SLY0_9GAMM|nr:FHA domain-containing protein [Xenorhabdus beddingii]OTA19567.1 putative FHA domain containing protein [Xenorhabdus beddingii]
MRFTIVKNTGTSQPPQLSHDFLPPGGTIGRSIDNNWCLPDEELAIARLQAIISISADGECRINNQGSASEVLLNMIPLAPDRQIEIREGDRLSIGHYQIQLMNIDQSSPAPVSPPATHNEQPPTTNKSDIPNEVWDNLEQVFTPPGTLPPSNLHQATPELNDNHPLAEGQQYKERNPIDPLAQIEATTGLEALQLRTTDPIPMFNSDTAFQQENILNDQTPTTLLQGREWLQGREQYGNQDDDKKEVDPLTLFADPHIKPAQHVQKGDPLDMMLNNAVPLSSPDHGTTCPEPQLSSEPHVVSTSIKNTSIKNTSIKNTSVKTTPPAPIKTPPVAPASSLPPFFEPEKVRQEPGQAQNFIKETHPHHSQHNHSQHNHQNDETLLRGKLLAALLEGMGLKGIHKLQFDEHNMYQLGRLVSQLSQGILLLNASRNQLKHKANADMIQTQSDTSNPFKLLPSGQSVLALAFGGHMPGFMPLEQATQDILDELQAHQLGVIAGMRATTADILHLFHPAVLEQKARDEGCLPRLSLSSTYKASMWDYLTQYYLTTASESEQDSILFGETFLQAYDAEVSRYNNAQGRNPK